ncbi:MAG: amidohydrolase family protein [Actinomycetota bacterium]|nr:amidohydrolase family protein [Actinomycetota bacterium]MDA3001802.1 amidohydrolase family protein [Actinomycetota bacterium]
MKSLEDLQSDLTFTRASTGEAKRVTFLPEPDPAERRYLIISADDHIVEPPHTFEGRMPTRFGDRVPHVIEKDGQEIWLYDGKEIPNVGFNAVVGRPVSEYSFEPARFSEMRRGAWDIDARISDMNLNGVYGSVNFPSFLPGFSGQRLQLGVDPELARAAVEAWNDWHIDEWAGRYPGRMIPCQIPWLSDPNEAADLIRRNAERGFKAVTFSEAPDKLGLPSIHSGYWEPFIAACAETGTVINLHIGSSGQSPATCEDAPPDVVGVLFFAYAMHAAVDWLYSMYPVKYPNLKICLSEGGIGWVAGLMDRLDHMLSYHSMYGTWTGDMTPAEVLKRNFWFCAVEDPSAFVQLDRIGVENVLLESDYPHCDSTWPNTQNVVHREIGHLPAEVKERITWRNAAELYGIHVPQAIIDNPSEF